MPDLKTIIDALRCSTKAPPDCKADCPYRTREAVEEKFRMLADYVEDGVPYCIGCDCDKIALDAAAELERVLKGE